MRAGQLHDLISIEQPAVSGVTALNENVIAWTEFCTAYVESMPLRASETVQANQRFSENVVRLRGRFEDLAGIDSTMRLTFGGVIYQIRTVTPDYQGRVWTIIEAFIQDAAA